MLDEIQEKLEYEAQAAQKALDDFVKGKSDLEPTGTNYDRLYDAYVVTQARLDSFLRSGGDGE